MQTLSTFIDIGWDFVGEDINGTNDFWRMCEDGVHYPHLFYQHSVHGDYACPDGVGIEDLEALAFDWLTDDSDPNYFNYSCDGNEDGRIGLEDYCLISQNWFKPYLSVSENQLFIHAIEGGPDPDSVELIVKNAGSGVLNWKVGLSGVLPDWLEMSPYTGTLGRGENEPVILSVDVNDLIGGDYIYDFYVVDPNAMNSPQPVTVLLQIKTPVAHWTLDETAGDTAADSSGHGYAGTLMNMDDNDWVTGFSGNALDFDGVDDYVEVPGYKGITGTASRTCMAWIKTTQTSGEIMTWGNSDAGRKWIVRVNGTGELRVEVQEGYIFGTTALNDGGWHHIAAVLEDDGSPDISEVQLYVDGQLEAISAFLDEPIDTANAQDVTIGVYTTVGTRFFEGLIDDVRIYDTALCAEEIAHILGQ
jgi:hypothetical protein